MPESEPVQVDTSPPSEAEAMGKIGFLEKGEAAGPHSLSLSFSMIGSEGLATK